MRSPRIHFFILLAWMCSCFFVRVHAQWEKFDPPASINILYDEKLISETERDTLLSWLRYPDRRQSSGFVYAMTSPLHTPEGILMQLAAFRADSARAVAQLHHSLIYGSSSNAKTFEYPVVKNYHRHMYGTPAPGSSFFDLETFSPLPDSVASRLRKAAISLQKAGLLSPSVASFQNDLRVFDLLGLTNRLAVGVMIERRYPEIRATEIQKARSLVEAGIMPEDQFKHLHLDYKANEIKGDFGLLNYCRYAATFTLDTIPDDLAPLLTEMVRKVGDQIPVRGVSDIKVTREELNFPGYEADFETLQEYYVVYLDYRGQTYARAFSSSEYGITLYDVVLSGFYQVFNRALVDAGSEYRLHTVTRFDKDGLTDKASTGFVFLTEPQWNAWNDLYFADTLMAKILHEPSLSFERFDNDLSPSRLRGIFSELESTGLMDHLSAEEKKDLWNSVWKLPIEEVSTLPLRIPGLAWMIPYELPAGDPAPYSSILDELAEYSHGGFTPSKIDDDFAFSKQGEAFNFSFKLKKKHKTSLLRYDQFDDRFFTFLEESLAAENSEIRLYRIVHNESFMWLSDDQYQTLLRLCPYLFETAEPYYDGE